MEKNNAKGKAVLEENLRRVMVESFNLYQSIKQVFKAHFTSWGLTKGVSTNY